MPDSGKTQAELLAEISELRARLAEPEDTVGAIRRGEVDAFVVQEGAGEQVYVLGTAELLRQLQHITDSLPVLVSYVDSDRRYRFINRSYEVWFGKPMHEIVGHRLADVLGESAYQWLRPHVDQALRGQPVSFENWLDLRGAGRRCVQVTLIPQEHEGQIKGYVTFVQDVSDRRRSAEALHLLADAGRLLATTPGSETLLADATRLAVPVLADWCAIELSAESGESASSGVHPRVVSAGSRGKSADGSGRDAAPTSRLDVPLEARGRTLGVWHFLFTDSRRQHRPEDTEVARELARRIAVALDNARLYRELEAANRAKDRFLATLSHELRTPLTPVLATASRLTRMAALPEEIAAGLELIERNVELEARLIDDLLDLTRISRGRLELHAAHADVRELLRQALETCDERARAARQIESSLTASDHVVWGDPVRLVQVFWNLLSNALKFTPEGGTIRIASRIEDGGEGAARRLVIEISDSGLGVEAEDLGHIFEPFDQGGGGIGRRYGGLGLGLAICRAIVELHGGELVASSAGRDAGTSFAVALPLAVGQAAEVSAGWTPEIGAPVTPAGTAATREPAPALHILLVEDHADTAAALAELLRAIGHRVTTASSVGAAIATVAAVAHAAETAHFDLVISDLDLPDGTGHELMRRLTQSYGMRGIALSGYGMQTDQARSRDAGFALHLTKPVDLETLQAAIQQLAATPTPASPHA